MRVASNYGDHAIIGRALAERTVEARDPSLINLPLPLPSVPILSPLLSPLLGGNNQNSGGNTQPASSSPASAPPSQTSAPSNNGGGNQGNTGGSGGGSTGDTGNTGGSTGGGDTGSGGGSTGGSTDGGSTNGGGTSGSDQGGSSGTAPTGGSGNSNPSTGNGSTGANPDTPSTGTGSNSGTGTGTGSTGSPSGDGTTINNGTSGDNSSTNSHTGSNIGSEAITGGGGAANVAPIPTGSDGSGNAASSSGTPTISGKGTTVGTHGASGGGNGGSASGGIDSPGAGNTDNGNGSGSGNEIGAAAKHGIAGGAIAGIVIALLIILLCAFVFIVRRRRKARRDNRAQIWWFTRKRNSQTYGDRNSREVIAPSNRSVRSSFATTVDHSTSPRPASFQDIPPLPPMAELGRSNGNAPRLVIDSSAFFPTTEQEQDNRFSIGSGNSDSQYLVVNHRNSVNRDGPGTPMSVRPFSPSESFAFPKPPDPVGDRNSAYSRPSSSGTYAIRNSLPPSVNTLGSPVVVPPTPALPTAAILSPINKVIDPFADNNPFDDPVGAPPSSASTGEFAEIEFIRRPFYPTLPDEVAVRPDDPVRIIQAFDDGWALIEKVRLDQPMGRAQQNENVKGLIPIDCLREPGQDLPSFFAAKRVSSYAGSDSGYNAI